MSETLTPEALDDLQTWLTAQVAESRQHESDLREAAVAYGTTQDIADSFKDDAEHYDLCLRALAQVRAAEWQPIETAPKDGTWIMVIAATAKEPRPWFVRMEEGDWVNQRNIVVPQLFTHWQPLPPLPSPASEAGD